MVAPVRLLSHQRSGLENTSGGVLLLAVLAASAQVFNLLTPDTGLLHVLVSVFFLVQLLTTLTAVRDRVSMLRSLAVLLGCAFVLRFIALESLYSPGRGVIKRVMTALMEGITLGALDYVPTGSATGYVAFLCLALYLVGLVLMPTILTADRRPRRRTGLNRATSPDRRAVPPPARASGRVRDARAGPRYRTAR